MAAINADGPQNPAPDWHPAAVQRVERITAACVDDAEVDGGGVALVTGAGHRGTVCATDERAARIEEIQFTLGEGPCVDASSSHAPVLVADLTDAAEGVGQRWPGFLEAAGAAGVRASFAFPVQVGAISLGAMDLYRLVPGALTTEQLTVALQAADALALALLDLSKGAHGFVDDGDIRSSYRLDVHAAAGRMSVQMKVPIEEALVHLRAVAYAQDRSISEVATDVAAGRLRFAQEES